MVVFKDSFPSINRPLYPKGNITERYRHCFPQNASPLFFPDFFIDFCLAVPRDCFNAPLRYPEIGSHTFISYCTYPVIWGSKSFSIDLNGVSRV